MNKIIQIFILSSILFGCKQKGTHQTITHKKIEFNQELVDELEKMAEIDQLVASNAFPPKYYSYLTQQEWEVFKDSVYLKNQKRAKEILDTYGFVGFDLAGSKRNSEKTRSNYLEYDRQKCALRDP